MESVAKNLDLDGKVVIDISVSWQQGDDGYPETTIQPSAAELIQKWNPTAKVVKTFATAGSTVIDDPAGAGGKTSSRYGIRPGRFWATTDGPHY
jgi:predicted dinucleotide-binding enzyme